MLFYFDITHLIDYAKDHVTLTGIQRVQLKVMASAARRLPVGTALGFVSTSSGKARTLDLAFLTGDCDVDFTRIRQLVAQFQHLLTAQELNETERALAKYAHKPVRRWFHLQRLAWYLRHDPARAYRKYGVRRQSDLHQDMPNLTFSAAERLSPLGVIVILGANWSDTEGWALALAHRQAGGQVLQFVHDLIPLVCPDMTTEGMTRAFTQWLPELARYPTGFVCNSHCSLADLTAALGAERIAGRAMRAVPLAHEFSAYPRNSRIDARHTAIMPLVQHFARWDYVLCVGTVEVRKNGIGLLRVWKSLQQEFGLAMPKLVFAGRDGWMNDSFKQFLEAHGRLDGLVETVPNASDADLAWLYQNCLFTAYPSFYEGWGLPVGEALWFGKYCVASRLSSLPEVGGDLVGYCDPYDLDDLKQALRRPLADRQFLAEREAAIREAPLRTWSQVADEILDAITGLAWQPAKAVASGLPQA